MERNLFSQNAIISAVEPALRAEYTERLKVVDLQRGEALCAFGEHVERVYFPLAGLIGIIAETPDGKGMNSSLVGTEGAIGLFEACGSRRYFAEAAVQVGGSAATMSASDYRSLFEASRDIRTAIHRYVEQLMAETRQSVICAAAHDVESRLSRLLIEALDKSGHERALSLTQETLARMLGSQRTTIAQSISQLQRDGVVTTRRGAVEIEDRDALERRACPCLSTIRITRREIWADGHDSCEEAMAAA